MQKVILILPLLVLAAFASTSLQHDELQILWNAWKVVHKRAYTSVGEDAARFAIFVDNYNKVLKYNAASTSVKLALNKFADLTGAEFKNKHSSCGVFHKPRPNAPVFNPPTIRLPSSVDWRNEGVVTPIKNQGDCGSCWAFSTTGVLEGFYAINTGTLLSFSEQQIVDCDTACDGCDGGDPYLALEYTGEYGIEQESDYPYTGEDGTCDYDQSLTTQANTGYSFVTADNTNALLTAIVSMPVSVAIEADQDVFQLYSSGVISSGCGDELDHAVLIVGYETVGSTQAFIVKNSWGTDWGMEGYVYIGTSQSANGGSGVCGILSEPVIPTN